MPVTVPPPLQHRAALQRLADLDLERWPVWLACSAMAGLLLASSAGIHARLARAAQRQQQALQQLQAQTAPPAPPPRLATPAGAPDFTAALPAHPAVAAALEALEQACAQAGVQLLALQLQDRPASRQQLGLVRVGAHVRGSYAAVRQVLGELPARQPAVTAQGLRFRSAPVSGTEAAGLPPAGMAAVDDGWLTFSVWSQPLAAD